MRHLSLKPLALAVALLCHFSAHSQAALPTGATVANGVVGINTFRDGMQVTNSPGAIINWNSFSIASGQTVRFDQLTAGSAVLNRVTGNSASNILGTLQSNGRVFLLNPNGIVFGAGSRVDTAGLLASTLNISDEDFLAGNYRFSCFNSISCEAGVDVLNPGMNRIVLQDGSEITTRNAGNGGQVWLIARDRVTSEKGSTIDAPGGQVMAAAAREVTVSSPALGQMTFTLTGPVGSQIDLAGDITVERGAAGFFADNIRLAGKVLARSEVDAAGQIVARAASTLTIADDALLDVSANPGADAGAVRLEAEQRIRMSAAAEIAADGGVFTASQPGGRGGVIAFKAAEVLLPATHGTEARQLHARGYSAEGVDLARYGRVDLEETGAFDYTVTSAQLRAGEELFEGTSYYNSRGVSQSSINTSHASQNRTRTLATASAGDAGFLIITDQVESETRGLGYNSLVDSRSRTFEVLRVDASGAVVHTETLTSHTGEAARSHGLYQLFGLTKGGWVATEFDLSGNSQVHFIDRNGVRIASTPMNGLVGVYAQINGNVVIETPTGNGFNAATYSSAGQLLSQSASSTSTEDKPWRQTESGGFGGGPTAQSQSLFADVRLELSSARNGGLAFRDRTNFTEERTLSPQIAALGPLRASGNAVIAESFGADPRIRETTVGMVDGDTFTALFSYRNPDSNSTFTGTLGRPPYRSTQHTVTGSLEDLAPMHTGQWLAVLEQKVTAHSYDVTGDPNSVTRRQTDVSTTNVSTTTDIKLVQRSLLSTPFPLASLDARVLTPPLLASQPSARNGVASTGGLTPPSGVGPTLPDLAPTTPAPAQPVAGVNPAAPAASLPPPRQGPAPRLDLFEKPAPSAPTKPPAGVSAKAAVAEPLTPAQEKELLDTATQVAEDLLGKDAADQLATAKTPEQRGRIAQEMLYAMNVGPEMYDVTRDLNDDMRGALFTSLSDIQKLALADDPALADGLKNALEKQREGTNPDGSPRGTAMQEPLLKLQRELAYAATPVERERVQRRMTRELIHSAKEQAGETVDRKADLVIEEPDGGKVRFTEAGDLVRS